MHRQLDVQIDKLAKIYTSKMYNNGKTQTNLPEKICHPKVHFKGGYYSGAETNPENTVLVTMDRKVQIIMT